MHDLNCVEIAVQEQAIRDDWNVPGRPHLFYARLDEEVTRWLGVVQQMGDRKVLRTFRDEWVCESDWGQGRETQLIRDDGRYLRKMPDGTYRTTDRLGIGCRQLTMLRSGARTFHCLRVWDTGGSPPNEQTELSEAYIEPGGRVVLFREFWGPSHGQGRIRTWQ